MPGGPGELLRTGRLATIERLRLSMWCVCAKLCTELIVHSGVQGNESAWETHAEQRSSGSLSEA